MVLDESTSGLDSDARDKIIQLLHKLVADGLMIVTVSHDALLASQASVVINLRDGRLHDE
jgi:zinc/manganese transport system ATP-binding protein